MGKLYGLDQFVRLLSDKGYSGYFLTGGAHPGKLKESLEAYMDECRKGEAPMLEDGLYLTTYLKWEGEDKDYVVCNMFIEHKDTQFDVRRMDISQKSRYGIVIKREELQGLCSDQVPDVKTAIEMVDDTCQRQSTSAKNRSFKL